MKQFAFLIDVSWLQDDETAAAIRYSCLQLITAYPRDHCKFGYLLFDSEGPRTQKVQPVDFNPPNVGLIEEFESQLVQAISTDAQPRPVSSQTNSQLATVRWAVSRSVTDFSWHSVSVCSPVKASRKRRAPGANTVTVASSAGQGRQDHDNQNLLVIFGRLPAGTVKAIRDELVSPSLVKCLQESRIDLVWIHDSDNSAGGGSSEKCSFLRMRDIIVLCGVFPPERGHHLVSLAPPSQIVSRLLQRQGNASTTGKTSSTVNLVVEEGGIGQDAKSVAINVLSPAQKMTTLLSEDSLTLQSVVPDPSILTVLNRSEAIFLATSKDPEFLQILAELRAAKSVAILGSSRKSVFMLKPISDSAAALVSLMNGNFCSTKQGVGPAENLFHGVLLERWIQPRHCPNQEKVRTAGLMARLAKTYDLLPDLPASAMESNELEAEPLAEVTPEQSLVVEGSPPVDTYDNEEDLLLGTRRRQESALQGRLNATTAVHNIVSSVVRFFDDDLERSMTFIDEYFKSPLKSVTDDKNHWANECRFFVLLMFETTSVLRTSANLDSIRSHVIGVMRKLLFLSSPRDLFDFVRTNVKTRYAETARPLLDDLAEEFDLPLFAVSEDDDAATNDGDDMSSVGSFVEPLSGISSLGTASITNSVPRSLPAPVLGGDSHKATMLRRLSSANLSSSQGNLPRQIEMPRRKSMRTKEQKPTSSVARSPQKDGQSTAKPPTTPRGKRILKTKVVPETPVGKQAPDRVLRTQERLRRRSSMLNLSQAGGSLLADPDDEIEEIEESPVKPAVPGSGRKSSRSPAKKGRIVLTPRKENQAGDVFGTPVPAGASPVPVRPSPSRKSPRATPLKNLSRQLRFSPQKKAAFTSPTAISLLHLTTSPVLFKPVRKHRAPTD